MTTSRISILIVLSVIAALAVLTVSMVTSSRAPAASRAYDQIELIRAQRYEAAAAQQAYLDQRRGEWTAGNVVAIQPASLPFREAEQLASAADAQRAYLLYREGEWNAGVNPALAYLNYRRGEWTGK